MANPQKLADDILKTIGDADANTAYTALEIARLLINHRENGAIDFERECFSGSAFAQGHE